VRQSMDANGEPLVRHLTNYRFGSRAVKLSVSICLQFCLTQRTSVEAPAVPGLPEDPTSVLSDISLKRVGNRSGHPVAGHQCRIPLKKLILKGWLN
jgi:hypothetical protein